MSNLYQQVESGTSAFKSRFTKSISNTMKYDCRFHDLIPVLKRFCLPGDVWKIGGDVLVRFQPMLSPSLTPNNFRVRYFFVPLRLIEPNTELVITGSKDGHLYNGTIPVFDNFVTYADKNYNPNAFKVMKYDFWDYMAVQPGDYESIKNDECLPANYWSKAYYRIHWDYYRDENLYTVYNDFESYFTQLRKFGCHIQIMNSNLRKDYFTSSLPWQLKGVVPLLNVQGQMTWTPNFQNNQLYTTESGNYVTLRGNPSSLAPSATPPDIMNPFKALPGDDHDMVENFADRFVNYLNQTQTGVTVSNLGFSADDLRTMMAQTRIFERLARCGSRYTEYLQSNFGTAPADGTLQRAQYLGGWKVPIVTTEVLQTAEDGSTPVGTMRGHGITRGSNSINTFHCKEFGILFGLAEIRPNVEYTTGIPRQYTYKRRFDFFNPSLQHLSEQEVRNGELFISDSDGKNDDTFGFQAYGNELRTAVDETCGDLRDSLSYWTQSLHFTTRPNLNNNFILGSSHLASFNAPFAVNGSSARPCIVQFRNVLDVYRPMVRYSTPGLVDHL